jgi:TRAP-type C4-dicarboxylate transport system permease small subunit
MLKIKKLFLMIENGIHIFAYISVFVMMLAITTDAIARSFFNSPIQGTYEVVGMYLMVIVVFLGISHSFKKGEHVNITLLYQYFSEKTKLFVDSFGLLLSILFFSIIALKGYEMTYEAWINNHYTFGIVTLPMFLSYIWVPIGTGVLTLRLSIELVKRLKKIFLI